MAQDQKPSEGRGKGRTKKIVPNGKDDSLNEDTCRCKEVSKKTLPEMLKLVLSDLAFWRRPGRDK